MDSCDECDELKELKEDMILVKHSLDIKERDNGERDKQIQYAKSRINEVGSKSETEDKTISERVINIEIAVAETRGYFKAIMILLVIVVGLWFSHITHML